MKITTLTREQFKNRKKPDKLYGRCPICFRWVELGMDNKLTPVAVHAMKEHPSLYNAWILMGGHDLFDDVLVKPERAMFFHNAKVN